ncbi:MurR/RpiR family transcriptional regulator [Neobacillus sp. PS3-12]|jgi:DNA-binding MurR/RpiR family transcriptional regulator|uniref:MurR/RpiR family transcriptional regulator n=1 Tax=Neobacillus sp. PS3-12 TaxID=3070677 RepID=UPI0027E0550C|nr:MurR/RpiR family transcriptional regulator [Neobacillus sp. PS3-12]WML50772.1 MurR/RpiR family transcriptional regulator [Neobacillus sp. PS3-12]
MAKVDILSLIRASYNSFTNTEKKIADYILENIVGVIYMSITDLADACNVGESSVFRFCKTMDLKGYQEFKIALAHSQSLDEDAPVLSSEITKQDTIGDLSSKILTTNVNALTETFNLINENEISKAIDVMVKAKRIHFFGVGASLMTAMEAKNKFMRITNKTECSFDSHLQIMTAALLTEEDVAILISYSGSTKDTIDVAKLAKENGAKLICITRFAKSPLTSYSDITLLCGSNEGPLQGGSLSAKISQLYLLDILYAEYFRRTQKESTLNKESTAKSVIEKML